VSAKSVLIS